MSSFNAEVFLRLDLGRATPALCFIVKKLSCFMEDAIRACRGREDTYQCPTYYKNHASFLEIRIK